MNANAKPNCQWCGLIHGTHCPLVRSLEYHANGTLKRVEFHEKPCADDSLFGRIFGPNPYKL